jgi:hypothetical protein
VRETKVPIDETTRYQFTKFACFDSDKVKNMSCSGGIAKANSKLGLKPVLFTRIWSPIQVKNLFGSIYIASNKIVI